MFYSEKNEMQTIFFNGIIQFQFKEDGELVLDDEGPFF